MGINVNVRHSKSVAIGVKYLVPTNTRGARVKAFVKAGKKVVHKIEMPWDYEVENFINYCNAAKKLAEKFYYAGNLVGGWFGDEYVCVFEKCN